MAKYSKKQRKQLGRRTEPSSRRRLRKKFDSQRKKRRQSKQSFLDPLTPRTARKEAKRAAKFEFGDEQRQVNRQYTAQKKFIPQVGTWYDQYKQDVAQATARSQAGFAQGIQSQKDAQTVSKGQETVDASRRKGEAEKFGRMTGAKAQVLPEEAQAALARQKSRTSQTNLLTAQKAIYKASGEDQGRIASGAKISEGKRQQRRLRLIGEDKRALAKRKGQFKRKYVSEARDKERTYALETKAFNLDVREAKEKSRSARAKERGDKAKRTIDRVKRRLSHEEKVEANAIRRQANRISDRKSRRSFLRDIGVSEKRWKGWSKGHQDRYLKKNNLIGGSKGGGRKSEADQAYKEALGKTDPLSGKAKLTPWQAWKRTKDAYPNWKGKQPKAGRPK